MQVQRGTGTGITSVDFPTGNVGIGTTTPAAKLDVAGNINIPQTAGVSAGVITVGGIPFMHACCGGNGNTFVGPNAGNLSTTGTSNTAIGSATLNSNTTGGQNTAAGSQALFFNTGGGNNTAIGASTLVQNLTGNHNTAVGYSALTGNSTGTQNTAVGMYALQSSNGADNTGVGFAAGDTNTTGSGNTFLGYAADAGSGALSNATAIGAGAVVSQSNSLVLGATGVNVGIGTATPQDRLQVVGGDIFTGDIPHGYNTGSDSVFVANNDGNVYNSLRMDGFANNLYLVAASAPGAATGAGIVFMTSTAGAGQIPRV